MPATVRIALAKGDGIGPEIVDATLALFDAAGALSQIEFTPIEMGARMFAAGNSRGMTDEAIRTVEECGILFKGPMETPKGGGGKSINVTERKLWSAFANLRRFQSLPGVETVFSRAGIPVDFFIVRENLEDTYGGIEHRVSSDVMQCKRLITAKEHPVMRRRRRADPHSSRRLRPRAWRSGRANPGRSRWEKSRGG